jgi:kynurenine formamidase
MSNWGRWGSDDERGALNLIDAAAVLRGVASVRTGEAIALGIPMRSGGGSTLVGRPPMQHFMLRDGADYAGGRPERGGFGFADDAVLLATHGATHIDALSHVFHDGQMYNGFAASEVGSAGARRCGIENVGPIVTRAVFVDFGELAPGELIGAARLRAAVAATDTTPEPGDALLVRTGWTEAWLRGGAGTDTWPGLDADCAEWIAGRELALVGADNLAVDGHPSSVSGCDTPLHLSLLRDRGVYLCELLDLSALAAAGRSTCMLVIAPLPLHGAVGSPVNPVAIL